MPRAFWVPAPWMLAVSCSTALWAGPVHAAVDCQALLAQHRASDMSLSYEQFDQTEGQGLRALAGRCEREAEQLVLRYIAAHPPGNSTLWWHAAQAAAGAGDYAAAAAHAQRALVDPAKLDGDPLRWNEYVQASIAYFQRDRAGLQHYRDLIAADSRGFWGNEMNVNLLDAMLAHFDEGYAVASAEAMKRWQARSAKASEAAAAASAAR